DIQQIIQNFFYRAMTGSLRIGDFWSNIPNYEICANCPHCGRDVIESLEHILTECTTEENDTIWNLVRQAWPDPTNNWSKPTLGTIIGCGSLAPTHDETGVSSPQQRGAARLKRILLSESAYLLWTMRCDRVIGDHTLTRTATITRWKNAIASRLDIDRRLARSKWKHYTKSRVLHTWSPAIPHPESLPRDWITNLEVLVGIKLPRPPD
ncbi:hypothetical protein EV363DRAFT_1164639, partial [Boletus edulis]